MLNKLKFKRQKGIGLLELMLSLAIIAVLLVMATRYYGIAHRSERLNEGISQVNAIIGAIENWHGNKASYAGLGGDGVAVLNKFGLLTKAAAKGLNTWGGPLRITGSTSQATISLQNIPQKACNALGDKFASNDGSTGPGACSGTTFTYIINDQDQ